MLQHSGILLTIIFFTLTLIIISKMLSSKSCIIMISVKVTPEDARKLNLPPECVNKTPSGETFVKSNLQKVG